MHTTAQLIYQALWSTTYAALIVLVPLVALMLCGRWAWALARGATKPYSRPMRYVVNATACAAIFLYALWLFRAYV